MGVYHREIEEYEVAFKVAYSKRKPLAHINSKNVLVDNFTDDESSKIIVNNYNSLNSFSVDSNNT